MELGTWRVVRSGLHQGLGGEFIFKVPHALAHYVSSAQNEFCLLISSGNALLSFRRRHCLLV